MTPETALKGLHANLLQTAAKLEPYLNRTLMDKEVDDADKVIVRTLDPKRDAWTRAYLGRRIGWTKTSQSR